MQTPASQYIKDHLVLVVVQELEVPLGINSIILDCFMPSSTKFLHPHPQCSRHQLSVYRMVSGKAFTFWIIVPLLVFNYPPTCYVFGTRLNQVHVLEHNQVQYASLLVTKVTFTSIFHPFFLTFSIPLPLRGGKLPTKRPYCGIPRHYGLLGLPSQHSLHSQLGITKTMMSTMTTGLLTHAAIQYTFLYSAAFCGWPY